VSALLTGSTLALAPTAWSAGSALKIVAGAGSFVFVDEKGDASKQITVYTYLPRRLQPDAAPIVFILHGHHKTAKGYRDDWGRHADRHGFMVVAPLFDAKAWGGGAYSYTSVIGKDGKLQDESRWSYSVIEHLFDAIKAATGNKSSRYFLYGFSEGGQFVHRLVLLLPDARYARAIVGTPGWYTLPRFDVRFPYGLGRWPATETSLKKSLERDVVLLLGGNDTDPNDEDLRRTRQALAQGANRLERGQNFFKEAEARAAQLNAAFGWRLRVVEGAAHEPRKMSGPAAAALMER
jgi:poly(3-hydroxybutyrate) depolymerase